MRLRAVFAHLIFVFDYAFVDLTTARDQSDCEKGRTNEDVRISWVIKYEIKCLRKYTTMLS